MSNQCKPPKFSIHYYKYKPISLKHLEQSSIANIVDDNPEIIYNPHDIQNIQSYTPIYNKWFSLDESNYNRIALNNKFHIVDMNTVINTDTNTQTNKPVFIKYSPLLDPTRYMVGKYETIRDKISNLPTLNNDNVCSKIYDTNNMAYVDCFFSYLSSKLLHQHSVVHCIDFYGSFMGIQNKFKTDITDDYEYLQSSSFFNANNNKLFHTMSINMDSYHNYGSHANKPRICISNTSHNISTINIDEINSSVEPDQNNKQAFIETIKSLDTELIYTKPTISKTCTTNNSSSTNSKNSDSDSDSDSDGDSDSDSNDTDSTDSNDTDEEVYVTDEDDDSSIEPEQCFAYINNFPVQCITLQKCDGTLDNLFETQCMDKDEGISILMQIIMTLLCYQKTLQFTHNDLHTNNIMYVNTGQEFIYYVYKRNTYKVPTFGKIYKIIDFGRAIYNYNGERFCSDSFSPSGDASTQYNCEPYMDNDKPRLDPNYSFDLCRLGCSLYDFVIDDDVPIGEYDEFQHIVYNWCLDDNNKNILYKKNGEERYPNFKLYKMIARTVHNKTPDDQLNTAIFKQYIIEQNTDIPTDMCINIDLLPEYYTKYM
jgi:hypothetical protein